MITKNINLEIDDQYGSRILNKSFFGMGKHIKTYEKTDTRQNTIAPNIANMASNYCFTIQKYAY